jgi:hypothetical protein
MRRIVIAAAMSLCMVSFATVASADTLIMRDGTRVEGIVTGIAGRTITFRHADGVSRRYPTSQVASLEFFSADRTNPRAASGRRLDAPAGTELVVRTIETIDSRNFGADQTFSALVERAVSDETGRIIISKGSSAQLVIRQVSSGGKTGSPEMVVDVQSITIEGRRYLISRADLTEDNETGIGTSAGTVAGGGKATAIGYLIGAADGADTQVRTTGREVKVPSDTVLRFRLDKPVTLRAEQ